MDELSVIRNQGGIIRVEGAIGGGDDGGIYMKGNAVINNGAAGTERSVIRTTGWFINERTTPDNAFVLNNPAGVVIMNGQSGPHISGTQVTTFNSLQLESGTVVTQDINANIDQVNELRIRESSELSTDIYIMTVLNRDPAAIVAEDDNSFISSESREPSIDQRPLTNGGRIAWLTQNNQNADYYFPVGHSTLGPVRRDVLLRPSTNELREYRVRVVAKDPELDLWTLDGVDPEQNLCDLNELYYHIVDDHTALDPISGTRQPFAVNTLAIEYGPNDAVNDLTQYQRDAVDTDFGLWIAMGADMGFTFRSKTFGRVNPWRFFDFPVFAFGLKQPLEGLSTDPTYLEPRWVFNNKPDDPRSIVEFSDNPDNDPRFSHVWTLYRITGDSLKDRDPVATFGGRRPVVNFANGFIGNRPFPPGTYRMELEVTNSLSPESCAADDELIFRIEPSLVFYIPDAFSPNGQGANEEFIGWFYGFDRLKFVVYNRWGDVISVRIIDKQDAAIPTPNPRMNGPEPDPVNNPYSPPTDEPPYDAGGVLLWDGKDKNGKVCQEGVYVYTLEVESSIAESPSKIWHTNGTISLIR